MLSGIGTTEIVVVALVLLVLFGGKKLPELAKGMGDSIKEFRKAVSETV
jgi:sec-independent protein translocase protein TatA